MGVGLIRKYISNILAMPAAIPQNLCNSILKLVELSIKVELHPKQATVTTLEHVSVFGTTPRKGEGSDLYRYSRTEVFCPYQLEIINYGSICF